MKKIYMRPTVDVIELKHQQTLLAGSANEAEAPEFEIEIPEPPYLELME